MRRFSEIAASFRLDALQGRFRSRWLSDHLNRDAATLGKFCGGVHAKLDQPPVTLALFRVDLAVEVVAKRLAAATAVVLAA